jgi:hypothetical protein
MQVADGHRAESRGEATAPRRRCLVSCRKIKGTYVNQALQSAGDMCATRSAYEHFGADSVSLCSVLEAHRLNDLRPQLKHTYHPQQTHRVSTGGQLELNRRGLHVWPRRRGLVAHT